MSQALMNGPSPLNQGEPAILAYAAGVAGCRFVCVAHSAVAYAWGVAPGTVGTPAGRPADGIAGGNPPEGAARLRAQSR